MLKLIGLTGVIISLGLAGICKSKQMYRRLFLLEDYYEIIIKIKSHIGYFKEPLPELFIMNKTNKNSKASLLLNNIGERLKNDSVGIEELWKREVNTLYKSEPIKEEDIVTFNYPCSFLGKTDYENQLLHFSYLEEKLNMTIERVRTDIANKTPMYNKIGFFIGAIIAILLI